MMTFRLLVVLWITDFITTPVSPSNVTRNDVTPPGFPANEMFENVTTNGSDFHENGTLGKQDVNVMSATDEARKLLETIDAYVYRIYTPITLALRTFTCVITILVLRKNVFRSSAAVYINGMAWANLLSGVVYIIGIFEKYEASSENRYWRNFYSYYVAYIFGFNYVAMAANAWTITAFAVERTMAIYQPLKSHVICSESRAQKIVICIFAVSFLVNIARFLRYEVRTQVNPVTNETMHVFYYTQLGASNLYFNVQYFAFGVIAVILPILILAALNVMIITKLRLANRKQLSLKEGAGAKVDSKTDQIERVLIASVCAFLVCNIMSATIYGTVALRGLQVFRQFVLEFRVRLLMTSILNALNPCLNFILYVCCSKTLRKAVKDLLRINTCCSKKIQSKSSSVKSQHDSCSFAANTGICTENVDPNE